MSVIIKNMEVPQYCGACHVGFCKQIGCELYIGFDDYATSRHPDCPISNIPTPHGRLGDLDELYNHLNEWYLTHEHGFSETEKIYIRAMLSGVEDSPTVVPASEEE